jgi:carboxypeptidase C (cathepsin A)
MAEATPNPPTGTPEADAAKRQQALVHQLLARPAAHGSGSIELAGRRCDYTTLAAFAPVMPEGLDGAHAEPEAAVLTTAYLLKGAAPARRPVCFAFNGGPGSASIWLHLGALGPQRVVVPDDGSMRQAPYAVEANPHSWFEHFDLVFIDPPHTGWSTTASAAARKKLLAVDGDITALAEVMRHWLTRNQRWGSPLYMAGESYGTTRGAGLALRLQDLGMVLSGVILVSCAMDLQTIVFSPANDLPYALFLPAFANVAQFHGLLQGPQAASPEAARAAGEAFVQDDYAAALMAGSRLSDKQRSRIAKRIGELTGLPRELVEEKNLRISDQTFFFEAIRSQGKMVGRLEARATGTLAASRTRDWEFDPGIEAIAGPYATAAMDYFGRSLGLDMDARYQVLSRDVNKGWDWTRSGNSHDGYCSTSPDLALALRRNPNLRVLVASGRYDLGTPYSASDWSLAHLDVPPEVMARVQHRYYDAGHMMYTRQADLKQLKDDVAAWLAA